MKRPLRVRAITRRLPPEHGYRDWTTVRIQQLQTQMPFEGWRTIDEEEVPEHALISLGAFGDYGGWVSKFASLGKFGRDGVIR